MPNETTHHSTTLRNARNDHHLLSRIPHYFITWPCALILTHSALPKKIQIKPTVVYSSSPRPLFFVFPRRYRTFDLAVPVTCSLSRFGDSIIPYIYYFALCLFSFLYLRCFSSLHCFVFVMCLNSQDVIIFFSSTVVIFSHTRSWNNEICGCSQPSDRYPLGSFKI
jgi:hypothetical protein